MLCRVVLFLLIVSCSLKGCVSVMCYWCSGVGDDRDCETRPYAVRTGPVYLNCRANFCLSAKVIDAETGQVQSFARLCDNVPRGNLCIRDSKLLTCYESCTSDLCNSGNPSPLQLPTVSYAGDAQKQQRGGYQDGFSPIQTREVLGRPYRTNSLKGARNIRYGPRRDMWLATPQHDFHSTIARRFPVIVTSTPRSAQFALRSKPASSDFLKAGMGRNGDANIELIGDKEFFGKGFKTTASESKRMENLNKIVTSSEKGFVYPKEDDDIPVVDRPKKTTAANKPESLVPGKEENADDDHDRANEDEDYMATMDIGYGERRQEVNDVKFIDEETAESEGEEQVYVGELDLDQIGRGGDGLVAWSGRIVERQELRREDEVPVSNLVIEEDRERGLIQTFRANTTKTTKDADKPKRSEVSMASKVVKKVNKSENEPTKVSAKSSVSTTTKPRSTKASTTVKGTNVASKVTSTKTSTTVTERPVTTKASTTVQSTTTPTKKTVSKITTIRNTIVPTKKTFKGKKSQKSKTNSTTKAATTTTSTTSTTAAPTFKKASTILSKTKAAIKLIKTKQTTLPYIWKETSAWNEDGTLADRTHQATWTSSKNTDDVTINITKVTKHKEVHLTDFLELQSTTEPLVVNATPISEPKEKVNKTSLPQRAPGKRDEVEIYLDESLTENLLGLRKDFQEETKAELTGSDSSAPSSNLFLLTVSMLFGGMYL